MSNAYKELKRKVVVTLLFFITIFSLILCQNSALSANANVNAETILSEETKATAIAKKVDEVYLGGIPIGIKLNAKGVLVTGSNEIVTEKGVVNPFKESLVNAGDVLYSINDIEVKSILDVQNIISNSKNDEVELVISKFNQNISLKSKLYFDKRVGKKMLGLKIKEDVLGIGTLTYVTYDKRFGALGHHIADSETGAVKQLSNGNIYSSIILGSKRGESGKAGHLNGVILDKEVFGSVDKNTNIGVFGEATNNIVKGLNKIEVGSRDEVKLGKAQIFSSIIGKSPRLYDVEIIKATYQDRPSERGMIIKVTDERLIKQTGGIVQGMSGSPIIQNGKLIGALTHVFLNDAKKGYGVYIDWMLES